MIKAVIFDFDGTLVDSEHAHEKATYLFLQHIGVSTPIGDFVGKGLMEFLFALQRENPHLAFTLEELVALYETSFLEAAQGSIEPYAKTIDLARQIKQMGIPLAIASGTQYTLLIKLVEMFQMQDIFSEHIYSSEDDKAGKPAPDIFLRTAKHLGTPPQETLVLEDSYPGYQAAKSAGMHLVMLPDSRYSAGYHFDEANLLFDTPHNLDIDAVLQYCQFQ
ncbi:HAD family phosphatase [Entomospira entomophila]|uniref:HAD family phosphatase n=1 Tax=Entomospira entomophila TaxID=2719988 RepID=A0A968GBV2_9SPIO|nr:HAD family phosphatase [Entomospira entomophilus]NIZ40511.1 HAD family phosphatase [Entomospira entomophilus]WDI36070.1 HAD family phosphatase [Entomospira entomophilus]